MHPISVREWQVTAIATGLAIAGCTAWWLTHRKRPDIDQVELGRRSALAGSGRIVDGMLLDGFQVTREDGSVRDMLLYGYEISGVVYECSQDITALREIVSLEEVKLGLPCSIRYQPSSPENSIVIAESWSGLREGVPAIWTYLAARQAEKALLNTKPNANLKANLNTSGDAKVDS